MGYDLEVCPSCAEDVRAEARRCTHCGARVYAAPPRRSPWLFVTAAAVVVLFGYGYVHVTQSSDPDTKQQQQQVECIQAGGTDC